MSIDLNSLAKQRHSVRQFTPQPLDAEAVAALNKLISSANNTSGIYLQLVTDEPDTFGKSLMAKYGKFRDVRNFLVVAATPDDADDAAYQAERVALTALAYGIGSCWVGLTYSRKALGRHLDLSTIESCKRELQAVIALGYPAADGKPHKSKTPQQVAEDYDTAPQWYRDGVDAMLLAPSAINKQPYSTKLIDDSTVQLNIVHGWLSPAASYAPLDRGIARLHFELGANKNITFI